MQELLDEAAHLDLRAVEPVAHGEPEPRGARGREPRQVALVAQALEVLGEDRQRQVGTERGLRLGANQQPHRAAVG